jgi:hypothetical protein
VSSTTITSAVSDSPPKKNFVHVMLQGLVSQVAYVVRVRVRTVFGWSPWSRTSDPFRTES